jgi:hypothetical protein
MIRPCSDGDSWCQWSRSQGLVVAAFPTMDPGTFSVESEGKTLPCGGTEQILDCVPPP